MINLSDLYVLSDNGETTLPSVTEKNEVLNNGMIPQIYLDANICLDIIQYSNRTLKNESIRSTIEILIAYAQNTGIPIFPNLGIVELCVNKKGHSFDANRYKQFLNKIKIVFDTPIGLHSNDSFEIHSENRKDTEELEHNEIDHLLTMASLSFITLLKIYLLAKAKTPAKATFVSNFQTFLQWCEDKLQTSLSCETILAYEVFAGNFKIGKTIALNRKPNIEKTLDVLHSTSWDMTHIREIHKARQRNSKYYLLSRDKILFELFKTLELESTVLLDEVRFITHTKRYSINPFKSKKLRDTAIEILDTFSKSREQNRKKERLTRDIKELDQERNLLLKELQNSA